MRIVLPERTSPENKDWFPTTVFHINTPDGKAAISILEKEPGKIEHMFMNIGKAGGSVNAWSYALLEMTMLALRNNVSIRTIIETLDDISCSRYSVGHEARSGPEAVAFALKQYCAINGISR
jgi:hypothetical protein